MADGRRDTQTGGRPATTGVIEGDVALSVGRPRHPAPDGRRWVPLTDVARLETGHTPSRRHPEYWGGDIPWIGVRDATGNHGRTLHDTEQHTNQLGIDNSSARVLPSGTVCLSRTASVGYVVVMGRPMATSQDFVNWVCGPELDPAFLKYVLLAETAAFRRFASGTTHQTIYFPEVKAFHVALPDGTEQRAIASALGALDDKIELNREMAATLDETARALFRSWFVNFDPVRDKADGRDTGLPSEVADLFPERLADSALGEIPEGWAVTSLDRLASFLNGLALQKFPITDETKTLPVIKIAQLRAGSTRNSDRCSSALRPEYIVEDGDVLFSWSGSLECVYWSGGQGALNQHLFKVTANNAPTWLGYLGVQHHLPSFRETAAGKATTMGHIQRHHLTDARVALPNSALIAASGKIIEPMLERSWRLHVENRQLTELRDALLPKLVSGAVRFAAPEAFLARMEAVG